MKIKVLIRSLVLLAGLAAWTADTAWGQASTRRSSSRGGAAAGRAAVEQRGEDDAVKRLTWETGKRIPIRPPENGRRGRRSEMPGETEKEQNGLDSLSLTFPRRGRLDAARKRTPARALPPGPWLC
ncbi:MAG: hypothetical protein ACLRPT_09340 [Akkermansia muciniphila]